jgi:hypothetical protein
LRQASYCGSEGGPLLEGRMWKQCPECAEQVLYAARVCRFCGHRFDEASEKGPTPDQDKRRIRLRRISRAGGMLVAVVLLLLVAVIFVARSGGFSEALYRLGLGEGWSSAYEEAQTDACRQERGVTVAQCNCLIDDLQGRLSQEEAAEFDFISARAGSRADEVQEAVEECFQFAGFD